jgi:hypothetical protein
VSQEEKERIERSKQQARLKEEQQERDNRAKREKQQAQQLAKEPHAKTQQVREEQAAVKSESDTKTGIQRNRIFRGKEWIGKEWMTQLAPGLVDSAGEVIGRGGDLHPAPCTYFAECHLFLPCFTLILDCIFSKMIVCKLE